jgi:hypothetical protein
MTNLKINKYFVCELLEHYLSQLGFYYIGSKSNQKKIVDLFYSLPFFFFDQTVQSILYKVIQRNNIKTHIDSNKSMKILCYNIYKDFCIKLNCPHKEYEDFYDSIKFKLTSDKYYMKKIKQNHIHSFIFSILFIGILSVYYCLSKRLYP